MNKTAEALFQATHTLNETLAGMKFANPVAAVYNPHEYAQEAWFEYLERFATGTRNVVFLGMNPGPWGMAQTGIPFGEVQSVTDWMGIRCDVGQPDEVHPKRPIQGFDCPRSEVSGRRLWGLMSDRYPDPESFFAEHFVTNYCPLVFMGETGRNITPDKLPANEREPLFEACDSFLATTLRVLTPKWLVGVGVFARRRLELVSESFQDADWQIGTVLHPSPASPAANRGWAEAATRQLVELGIWDQ